MEQAAEAAGGCREQGLERMTAQFRALHAIGVALTSSLQLDRVLTLILEKAVELVRAEHGSLRLLNTATGELVLKAFLGEGWTAEIQAYRFRVGQGITGWVAEQRRPYLCPDALHDPQNVVLFQEMRSGVAVPLLAGSTADRRGGEVLGVLLLESTRTAAFDEQDVELLEALAQQAVIAMQNATRHEELQRVHRRLQDEQERRVAAEKWTVMGQAATALAHRINNLIGILPASVAEVQRVLAAPVLGEADRRWVEENLDRIDRNARYVLRLSDALFRPFQEAGARARFGVGRLLNEAAQAAGLSSAVHIVRDYAEQLPEVESSSLLVDTFLELIANAGRAMECRPEKRLTLSTALESNAAGTWVVAAVSDTGGGIPAERMPHLWDMFMPSAEGLGFGLWWVRTFIEQQGGSITCENRPGDGVTFTVRLPAAGES